jgi:hypothetical protein
MIREGFATVANIITDKKHRRKGFAAALWKEAKVLFPNLSHSDNLSADGRRFARKYN